MTLKDRYGFGGFSCGTPPSEPNLSTPPPPPRVSPSRRPQFCASFLCGVNIFRHGTQRKGRQGEAFQASKGEVEEENERAISPQPVMPVVDAEGMDTGSNREEEDEPDDDEVTGKQFKEKYEYDATVEQKLVDFFAEKDCFYNKGSEKYASTKYKKRLLEVLARELNTSGE